MRQTVMKPFALPTNTSVEAEDFEQAGNRWNPQLHFTGMLNDPMEKRFIGHLLRKYASQIAAHYIYSPYPGTYSIELQFKVQDAMERCRTEYRTAFNSTGRLKKSVIETIKAEDGSFSLIVVRPGTLPEMVWVDASKRVDVVAEAVGERWERIQYPAHLGKPLTVLANENGINEGLPYNCWGLVGGFVITRFSANHNWLTLPENIMASVIDDLSLQDDGYLNPESNVNSPFREPFALYGIPPSGWSPPDGAWFKSRML